MKVGDIVVCIDGRRNNLPLETYEVLSINTIVAGCRLKLLGDSTRPAFGYVGNGWYGYPEQLRLEGYRESR